MNKLLITILAAGMLAVLSGCNCIAGLGEDIAWTARTVEQGIQDYQQGQAERHIAEYAAK